MSNKEMVKKLQVFLAIMVLIFVGLGVRLYFLQIVNAEAYEALARKNRSRDIFLPARRGNIYDANMEVLATSKPVFSVSIATTEVKNQRDVARRLAEILNDPEITEDSIMEAMKGHFRRFEPLVIKRLPYEEGIQTIVRIEERRDELPGVIIQEEPMRYYPMGHLAGQILGTVGLISKGELDVLTDFNYRRNDWLGKGGLERVYERYQDEDGQEIGLRGKRGVEKIEVNAKHRLVRMWSHQDPVPGNSLVLTLDARLQQVMETAMSETMNRLQKDRPKAKAGAAVLIEVKTGKILAMASAPFMDPNDFANGLSKDKIEYYWDSKQKPTFNRAVSGVYPPGSTFKIVTALSILTGGTVTPKNTVTCTPSAWVIPRAKCWKTHGTVNYYSAMAGSCNTYFQEMGSRAGIDLLNATGKELWLGQKTGIDLPAEAEGTLPSREWKAANYKGWESTWRPYDTFYMSMGQGGNSYTPLQLANFVAAIANGGQLMKPYLVDKILSPDGQLIKQMKPQVINELSASDTVLAEVKKAMRAVIEPGGTAYSLFKDFPPEVKVAGKTGTAQTGLPGDDKNADFHGLFVAFAPYENPEIAFAGIIEYGYHGGSSSGLVAKAVFEEYFGLKKEPIPDELPESME